MIFYNGNGAEIIISNAESSEANNLEGKKWKPIGDSITTQASYRCVLSDYYGLVEKDGMYANGLQVGYSSGASHSVLSFTLADEIPDIITIALGTNDFGNNCPIGTIQDDPNTQTESSYTFMGCYKKLIEWLYGKYGRVPMILITPFPRKQGLVANSAGKTLLDYSNAIRQIGSYYSIKVVNMQEESGLPIGTLSDDTTYFYTVDGLHLTKRAGRVVAPKIADAMTLAIKTSDVKCIELGRSAASYTLTTSGTQRIYVSLKPTGTTEEVVWTSNNTGVVTVEAEMNNIYANLKAVASGKTTVVATCGDATTTFNITVN